jgi:hypothetical protein
VADEPVNDAETPAAGETKEKVGAETKPEGESDGDDSSKVFEPGVEAARAMTETWSMQHLIIAYIL